MGAGSRGETEAGDEDDGRVLTLGPLRHIDGESHAA